MPADLAGFLRARLAEDEKTAQGLLGASRFLDRFPDFYGVGGPAAEAFWGHFTPWRMLADITAKRALIDLTLAQEHYGENDPWHACPAAAAPDRPADTYLCECGRDAQVAAVLALLAAPYEGHPDHRAEWQPSATRPTTEEH